MPNDVTIKGAVKRYGSFTAVNRISLAVKPGEFFTLLGPSGCGKTTLLRMIAGFNSIDEGEIYIGERLINNVPAHKRDIGMVFQNYAIFPHMTVEENVAYGLKAKGMRKNAYQPLVKTALEQVQIASLATRRPNELSGGQQQRVALARAFVIEPGVLLMDEPLSNLDAKLRVQMRSVIKKLQRRLGITTIYVTHDQEEALSISDRIAVMKDGVIMQLGTPKEIYSKPQNPFVAGFIGISNFMEADVKAGVCHIDDYAFKIKLNREYEGKATVAARPEQLSFSDEGLSGNVTMSTFLGDFIEYEIALDNGQTVQLNEYTKDQHPAHDDGERVKVKFDPEAVSLYQADNGEVLSC